MAEEHYFKNALGRTAHIPIDGYPSVCPHCEESSGSQPIHTAEHLQDPDEGIGIFLEVVFKCRNPRCERIFIAGYTGEQDLLVPLQLGKIMPPRTLADIKDLLTDKRIPERVREDLLETNRCYRNGSYQAFGAMVRRIVHSICSDLGASGRDLYAEIEDLRAKGLVSNEIADRAQDLRTLGRHGAHPEWETVTEKMADLGIQHLLWIIRTLYQCPPDQQWRTTGKRR